jgi:ribosomal-protein-alanine N-acetyltransferase
MTPEDLDRVLAIASLAFEPPWTRDHFVLELERAFAVCSVVEQRGAVVAYVVAWVLGEELEVLAVATHPDHRRAGHARRLTEHALDVARARDAKRGFLEVRADNAAAIALYESLGFRCDARRERYYADGTDAWIMVWQAAT